MDLIKIQKEVSFLKGRLVTLDEELRNHLSKTYRVNEDDDLVNDYIKVNMYSWQLRKYIPTKEVIDGLNKFVKRRVTPYSFNQHLDKFCNDRSIVYRKDFSKRYEGVAKKSYYFV